MNVTLETQKVSRTYQLGGNTIQAVDAVSLAIHAGELVALVGPSGSGKTTLLAMLAALLKPSDGHVMIEGHELGTMPEAARTRFRREKIGFTFQGNNLVSYLTAQENVELMLRLNGRLDKGGKARARELLARLGLSERMGNLPRQLSGGQQQRVAIARALVHNPAIVLADEPTASLDTQRAHQVVETFVSLIHEQQRAGIMVTHDMRMVQYADRVIQMMDGKVLRNTSERNAIDALASTVRPESQAPREPSGALQLSPAAI